MPLRSALGCRLRHGIPQGECLCGALRDEDLDYEIPQGECHCGALWDGSYGTLNDFEKVGYLWFLRADNY
jgi:hypothetical protein